jgi:Ca2+-binding RTX toxin-like protein
VLRTGSSTSEVSATITLGNGTATAPADYDNTAIVVTFASGEISKTINVPIVNDTIYEGNETVQLGLTNPTGDATLGAQNAATLTIIDNDAPVPGSLSFSDANYSVNEDGTPIYTVTLIRTGGSDGEVSAQVNLSNGTAVAPDDYSNSSIVVSFANGETLKTVTIPVVNDTIYEGNETVNLTLSNPTGGATLGTQTTATLTIVDNELPPAELSFNQAIYSVNEDGTPIVAVTVIRAGNSNGTVSAKVNLSNGTAVAPDDYNSNSIVVTFNNGETAKTVTIPVVDDLIVESTETINLTLADPTNGAILGTQTTATLNIVDNDVVSNHPPTLNQAIADANATEDLAFSFTIDAGSFTDVDAGDVLSYSATLENGDPLPSWLSFDAATRTFSGTPTNSDVGAIEIKVTVRDLAGATASDVFTLNVANTNDAPVLNQAIADANATEDLAFSFTIDAGSFTDVDAGDVLSYSATLENGDPLPSWLSFDAATRTFSGTPTNSDVGAIEIKVTVRDLAGAEVSDVFTLNVANVEDNHAPTVNGAIAEQTAIEDRNFSFVFPETLFSDVDTGDVLAYSATLENGDFLPSWLSFNANTRTFSGTPADADVGTLNLKLKATDPDGLFVETNFKLGILNLIQGTSVANSLIGGDRNDYIEGLEGRDTINGGKGDDVIIGGSGADLITGGEGKDKFVYISFQDIGDKITDFNTNDDKIVLTDLLKNLGYSGSNSVADGYVRWVQGTSGTNIQIDPDGANGSGIFRPFIQLDNVSASNLNSNNFIF